MGKQNQRKFYLLEIYLGIPGLSNQKREDSYDAFFSGLNAAPLGRQQNCLLRRYGERKGIKMPESVQR